MNVVREINKINELELELGASSASWHDEYKDSAYIFIGGLHLDLTEGDVITIFSQFGEIMDIHLPRDKESGKTKGFGFLMYEDQRSTVLAVDNLNGAKVLERVLRVDHVKNYKQPKRKEGDEWVEAEEPSYNARPEMIVDDEEGDSDSSASSGPQIDPEDPMYDYLIAQRREKKALSKQKLKTKKEKREKRKDETSEEKAARRAVKKQKKEKKAALKAFREEKRKQAERSAGKGKSEATRGVEALLASFGGRGNFKRDEDEERDVRWREEPRSITQDIQMRSRSLSPRERDETQSSRYYQRHRDGGKSERREYG